MLYQLLKQHKINYSGIFMNGDMERKQDKPWTILTTINNQYSEQRPTTTEVILFMG
jgi:hypothetical protein